MITATFIGYLVAGLAGALVATVAIFTPIWLGVSLGLLWRFKVKEPLIVLGGAIVGLLH